MKTVINIKADKEVKEEAQKLARELGVPLSTVINSFLKQFIREREINLSMVPRMTPYLEGLIEEAQAEWAAGLTHGPFATTDEALDFLHNHAD